MQQCNLLKFP